MSDLLHITLPIITLLAGGLIILMLGLSRSSEIHQYLPGLTLLTILYALAISFHYQGNISFLCADDSSLRINGLSLFAGYLTLALGGILVLATWGHAGWHVGDPSGRDDCPPTGEFYAMMLFSLGGLLLVFVTNNLIILFLALELVSIPTYILVALSRSHPHAAEAGLKYFFLGALSAALIAFGLSYLYGLAGSANFAEIRNILTTSTVDNIYLIPLVLVIVGLCFKIGAVPMHFYIADVYQGAAAPVSAFLAFVPKFAGFYALVLILSCFESLTWFATGRITELTVWILWIIAAATITVGNVLALRQRNVKRILAYSAVAHTGYIMLAVLAFLDSQLPCGSALGSLFFYICAYALATIGAFSALSLIQSNHEEAQELSDLSGLARRHPVLAAALAVCIFSLVGMPLTAGFSGKLIILANLVKSSTVPYNITLVVIAVLNIPVAAAYYLRIIAAAYIDPGAFTSQLCPRRGPLLAIAVAALLTILLGLAPKLLLSPLYIAAQN